MSNTPYISETQVASSTPFDPTNDSSDGFVGSDVQSALNELRDYTIYDPNFTVTSNNGTLTLTAPTAGGTTGNSSSTFQILTGSGTNYSIVHPDARTLKNGQFYMLANTTAVTMTPKDNTGAAMFTLAQNSLAYCYPQDNSTQAGIWLCWQQAINVASGIVVYNITSSTTFSTSANVDTLITGMSVVPQAGTYSLWYNAQNTASGSGQQMDATIYNGAATIADSVRSNLSTSGTHIFQNSTQTTSQFNGTNAASIKVNANGNSMTVGARSLLMIRTGT